MKLQTRGTREEQLLFQLLGIHALDVEEPCGLLLGIDEPLHTGMEQALYLRLPDPAHPDRETKQLAKMLGRAIGLREVHL
jgi:hypothetical protein